MAVVTRKDYEKWKAKKANRDPIDLIGILCFALPISIIATIIVLVVVSVNPSASESVSASDPDPNAPLVVTETNQTIVRIVNSASFGQQYTIYYNGLAVSSGSISSGTTKDVLINTPDGSRENHDFISLSTGYYSLTYTFNNENDNLPNLFVFVLASEGMEVASL